jgi:hypothetical protein
MTKLTMQEISALNDVAFHRNNQIEKTITEKNLLEKQMKKELEEFNKDYNSNITVNTLEKEFAVIENEIQLKALALQKALNNKEYEKAKEEKVIVNELLEPKAKVVSATKNKLVIDTTVFEDDAIDTENEFEDDF